MKAKSAVATIAIVMMMCSCTMKNSVLQSDAWKAEFENDLNLLGHRNWVLVVDKAFPEQSSPGIKYLYVDRELLPTLQYVLDAIDKSTHVSPEIFRDLELSYITDEQVGGIDDFKTESSMVLGQRMVQTMLHEDVFKMLNKSSELFSMLVIKTNCTLPYTSFFIRLDCAYWNPDQEEDLRRRMAFEED